MTSSVSSSAKASPTPDAPPSGARPRKAFALAGRSVDLDPRTHAVRPDLADVRLAREPGSEMLAELEAGATFELLDVTGDAAWGVAPARGLVGYLPVACLA